ncbi:hypothetical protein COV18_01175 [Candidatus Woesearchaeota archaeon CG10_big_fil_rev_8_21_14_0_10_37_12]|nr:MAG: hypothetical protein COV18_01175 [Candidatus Woesearchaeota archaeon CG10_big_fil_rev_8_21_14_0_10_37_12]
MGKIKQLLTNFRVIVLLIFLILGLFALYPNPWNEGVSIKGIQKNSSAELAGIIPPKATLAPMARERIIAVNNRPVADVQEFYQQSSLLEPNDTVSIKTNRGSYTLVVRPKYNVTELNETEFVEVNETRQVNETVNGSVVLVNETFTKEVEQPIILKELIGIEPLGFSLQDAPNTNLRKGLDLQGGTRVLLRPIENISDETLSIVADTLKERLNVFGLSDVLVTTVSDTPDFLGGGNQYILVELAGASDDDARQLLGKEGKFEAKIANETVFVGGKDITYVCRSSQCSGLDPNRGCTRSGEGWNCGFMFSITLSPEAAERQARLTGNLKVVGTSLSDQLVLYLDDAEVDRLSIAPDLKGRAVTDIAITGGGDAISEEGAIEAALENMKQLQTVLSTGSLPVKLEIERIDTISPTLGKEFVNNALLIGALSLLGVAVMLFIVYRKLLISIPLALSAAAEIFLTLSLAALIGWNIDLAAIAGIIIAVGTGVNHQIVITDETLRRGQYAAHNWKEGIKRAFFIIFSAYFTAVVAMLPLYFAGAGLLKGFALTTILALTIGVFVTRPAYASIIQILLEKK